MSETGASPAEDEAGRFACPVCPARFESVGDDKRRHLRAKHTPTSSGGTSRRARSTS